MHVLIATTGVLTPGPVAEFTRSLAGPEGHVTVTTVIEVPRSFLDMLRKDSWHPLELEESSPERWAEEEAALTARYVEERGRKLTEPVVSALRAVGLEADTVYLEGDDPASAISSAAEKLDVDVVVLGATRKIFDHGVWESVSARVMIESGRPVLVVPPPVKDTGGGEDE